MWPKTLPDARNLLIGSNGLSLAAMAAAFPGGKTARAAAHR
jgi:hypothetical protein